jgi:hypothetical protein
MTQKQVNELLKKEAKVLADRLADSCFWGLADKLADSWRIDSQIHENPVTMLVPKGYVLADRLADMWRWPIRQSATPFRVADRGGRWRIRAKKLHKTAGNFCHEKAAVNITMM